MRSGNFSHNEEIQSPNDNVLDLSSCQNLFMEESVQNDDDIGEEDIFERSDDNEPISNSNISVSKKIIPYISVAAF